MSKPKKIKWEKAKSEYVGTREMSLKSVAKKFGMSYGYLRNVSQREGWVADKERRWKRQEKEALNEVEGSIKNLIVRHAEISRFLQGNAIERLQKRFKELKILDEDPALAKKIKQMDDRTLVVLLAEGLRAERELYPKQMQIEGDVDMTIKEASNELKKAANEALKKQLTKRRRSSKHSSRS